MRGDTQVNNECNIIKSCIILPNLFLGGTRIDDGCKGVVNHGLARLVTKIVMCPNLIVLNTDTT